MGSGFSQAGRRGQVEDAGGGAEDPVHLGAVFALAARRHPPFADGQQELRLAVGFAEVQGKLAIMIAVVGKHLAKGSFDL